VSLSDGVLDLMAYFTPAHCPDTLIFVSADTAVRPVTACHPVDDVVK
jgi:hypothetical protein